MTTSLIPGSRPAPTLFGIEWSVSRHELIAAAAERLLTPPARTKVSQLLAPLHGQTLTTIAGWADKVKRRQPQPGDDPDTVAFLQDARNANNPSWHFVDIPVNATAYDRTLYPEFTNDEDVVQMLRASTLVLMNKSNRFSPLNALRLVVHLMGDVHQPLHVGCCYVGQKNGKDVLVRDPAKAKNLPSDHGGNNIMLPTGGSGTSMHSFWDGTLPGNISLPTDIDGAAIPESTGNDTTDQLEYSVEKLLSRINASADLSDATLPAAATTPDLWGSGWATQSLLQAREAYKSLTISQKVGTKFKVDWEGRNAYTARCSPIVSERLTAAASNLAKLLNTVFA
jgi:hypothetical protein